MNQTPRCPDCQHERGWLTPSLHGYSFQCAACYARSDVRVFCPRAGHRPRVVREGIRYYLVCEACARRELIYQDS
ncbi:MAG: hypothetical protein VKP62_03995 [Candidatus Sericytochromatia bacterium]|nr:hypothetical protein [Candidatus Sericytochromatia bacterium]